MLLKWMVLVVVCGGGGFGQVRDKRTLDFVLRSVADAFGYDVQKRPSVLPLAAPTQAARPSSTFFPPPVKPLPPLPRMFPIIPRPTVVITLPAKPVAAPAAPPAAPKAVPTKAAPAAPKAPAPAAPAPAPAKPAPAAPAPAPRVTAPPLLTENVRKTFNIAFNVVRDVQTPAPAAPSPARPAAPAPAKPPARPAPPPPPPPPPRTPAPPPPPPPPRAKPPKRAELYQLYPDYYDSREKYQNLDPANYDYDLTNNGQQLNQPKESYDDSKQRFKESLDTFWRGSPWIQQQNGYKYLTPAPPPPPPPQNKYEEYEIEEDLPQRYRDEEAKYAAYEEDIEPQNEEEEYYVESYKDSNQPPVVRQYSKNPEEQESNNRLNYSKERPNFTKKQPRPFKPEPHNQKRNQDPPKAYLSQSDRVKIFSPEETKRPPCVKVKRRPVTTTPKTATVAPQFAGVLPVSLHALTDKSRNPWPLPFDADYAASVKREVRQNSDFSYVPEKYEAEASYEPPEPEAVDYKALEKLTNFEEVDKELSDNAKVRTSQSAKRVTRVNVDKGITQVY